MEPCQPADTPQRAVGDLVAAVVCRLVEDYPQSHISCSERVPVEDDDERCVPFVCLEGDPFLCACQQSRRLRFRGGLVVAKGVEHTEGDVCCLFMLYCDVRRSLGPHGQLECVMAARGDGLLEQPLLRGESDERGAAGDDMEDGRKGGRKRRDGSCDYGIVSDDVEAGFVCGELERPCHRDVKGTLGPLGGRE